MFILSDMALHLMTSNPYYTHLLISYKFTSINQFNYS